MPKMKLSIESREDYSKAMHKIDALMKIGEKRMTAKQADELRSLAIAAEAYEKTIYKVSPPSTLEGLLEWEMFQRKLKQKDLAKLLGIHESKLSEIMNSKRPADVAFLKAAHQKLGIDGNSLLDAV